MNFGILCNGYTFQQWQLESIRLLIENGHTCALLIVNDNPVEHISISERLIQYPYSKIVCRIWFRYMMKPAAKRSVDIMDFYKNIPDIQCLTKKIGYAEYFHKIDV